MISLLFVCLFVCLFVSKVTQKLHNRFLPKLGGIVAHGPRKKPLDFVGNADHIMLGFGVIVELGLLLHEAESRCL